MRLLQNAIQPYAWGSTTSLPALLGVAPDGRPQAELWMGAHPLAPSRLKEEGERLDEAIAREPERWLGAELARRYDAKLPFLLKILAAAEPLSLQAHPSLEQAREGFADEEARGIPRDAPHRNYKDANHKPELLCALTPFHALCGFRVAEEIAALFEGLGVADLGWAISALRGGEAAAHRLVFARLMTLPDEARARLVAEVSAAARASSGEAYRWAARMAELYPGDAGVITSMMLNLVTLAPGEAIYLPAGNLHAYLDGTGVELMASSDNVLRGGLTKKHVDVAELLKVLDFSPRPASILTPVKQGAEAVYPTPAPEFRLSRIDVTSPLTLEGEGPRILFCLEGPLQLRGEVALELQRGQSVVIPATERAMRIEGRGIAFLASVNAPR